MVRANSGGIMVWTVAHFDREFLGFNPSSCQFFFVKTFYRYLLLHSFKQGNKGKMFRFELAGSSTGFQRRSKSTSVNKIFKK